MPNLFYFVKICVEKVFALKDFIKNNWQILLPEFLVITIFIVFYGQFGDIMIDSYREIYIPQQMLEGNTLYKDIFVIYPPLAYLINALLIKVFGNGLITLYYAGLFSSIGILYFTYKIAKKFLGKIYPLAICLFLIAGLILSPNVFNTFLPYSYGILYGTLFILISLYFAINKNFPLMYLFYSLAILCKYEFVLLLPLLIFLSKKTDWKKNLLTFGLPIFLTLGILVIQGVRIEDIKASFQIIGIMSSTKTLYWFYSVMGLTFRPELIPIYLTNILKFIIPVYWIQYQEILVWAFPIIAILGVFRFKNLKTFERFFIIATLLVSAKVFFALTLQSYGVYFLPLALISLFILTPKKLRNILCILLITWSVIIAGFNIKTFSSKKTELTKIVNYIKTNTKANEKVLIYPECLAINVFSERTSDNKFYSLIPLYAETFGEDLVIKRLEIVKPEYIIINNYDTSSYYFKEFGTDYGQEILKWIEKNYKLETIIEDKWMFKIYKSL